MSSSGAAPEPSSARLGNPPSPLPDVPVTAVFLALYFLFLLGNIVLFVRNSRNGHKFWLSLVISGRLLVLAVRHAQTLIVEQCFVSSD